MEDEIDLFDIFGVLWRSRLLIIGIFTIAVLVAGIVIIAMPPIYKTSSIIALGNFGDDIYTSQAAALTIMLSDEFLLDVFQELKMTSDKFSEFKKNIIIENVKGTDNLFTISVYSKNQQEGMRIIQGIIQQFSNLSEESYNRQTNILSNQLANTNVNLEILNRDVNESRVLLKNIQNNMLNESPQQNELRFSQMIEYLPIEEKNRQDQLNLVLDLQKQLTLARHLKIVQEPRVPLIPDQSQKIIIVAVAGILGLIIGIFTAFLRDWLRRRAE